MNKLNINKINYYLKNSIYLSLSILFWVCYKIVDFHPRMHPNVKKKMISWRRDILKPFNIIYAVIIVAFQKDSKIKDMFQTYDTLNVFFALCVQYSLWTRRNGLHHMFVHSNFFYIYNTKTQLRAQSVLLRVKLYLCVKLHFA